MALSTSARVRQPNARISPWVMMVTAAGASATVCWYFDAAYTGMASRDSSSVVSAGAGSAADSGATSPRLQEITKPAAIIARILSSGGAGRGLLLGRCQQRGEF